MSSRRLPARLVSVLAGLTLLVILLIWSAVALKEPHLTIAIHQGVEGEALRKIAASFSREQKITVDVVDWPYDQLFDEEKKDLQSSTPRYDVLMLDDPWLPALIDPAKPPDGFRFQKLFDEEPGRQAFFNDSDLNQLERTDFVEPTLDVCRYPYGTGPFYALPFVGNSQLFCYLESDFASPNDVPATWQCVLRESKRIVDAPNRHRPHGYIMRVGKGNSIVTDFLPVLWEADEASLCPLGLHRLDPKKSSPAFEFLKELGNTGEEDFSVVASDDFDLAVHLKMKKASMCIVWSAWAMAIARLPEPEHQIKDRAANIPEPKRQKNGATPQPPAFTLQSKVAEKLSYADMPGAQPALGAWLLAVSARSAHPEEAKKFLLFATSKEGLTLAAIEGNPPPRQSVLTDPELKKRFPSFDAQYKSLTRSRPRTRTPYWRELEDKLGECLSDLYANATTVDVAIDRINNAIDEIRKKEKSRETPQTDQCYLPDRARGRLPPIAPTKDCRH